MNLSGILVVCPVSAVESTIAALRNLAGVEVHHTHRSSGRIVVTQEAESIRDVEGAQHDPFVVALEAFPEDIHDLLGTPEPCDGGRGGEADRR